MRTIDKRINENGVDLLQDIAECLSNKIVDLTIKQVCIILSLQDVITYESEGEWKVKNKKKSCGKLNIEQISNKYFLQK